MPIIPLSTHTIACLGLGSNLGDSAAYIRQALRLLDEQPGIRLHKTASLYRTEPIGVFAVQENTTGEEDDRFPNWFINTAAMIETELNASDLLETLLSLEQRLGRSRQPGAGYHSRTLDIDLLFYGESIIYTPVLEIPHPRLHERAFVLVPLLELVPDWVHPVLGKTVNELYQALNFYDQRIERFQELSLTLSI